MTQGERRHARQKKPIKAAFSKMVQYRRRQNYPSLKAVTRVR
jgi:hypothetical protein